MKSLTIRCSLPLVFVCLVIAGCGSRIPTATAVAQVPAPNGDFTPTAVCEVPNVVGETETTANALLVDLGLQPVKSVGHAASARQGSVISQEPAAGTRLQPCKGDVTIIVNVAVPTEAPTTTSLPAATPLPTATQEPTDTPTPEPLPTETPVPTQDPNRPSGEWAVRAYRANDRGFIFVNGQMIGLASPGVDTDWIAIKDAFQSGTNTVTFVTLNAGKGGTYDPAESSWGFAIRYDDSIVWGNEGDTSGQPDSMSYAQIVQILPDNTVNEINLRDFDKELLGGTWTTRIMANDAGVVFVNGIPVTGAFSGWSLGWVDCSGLMYANQDNIISSVVWNVSDEYSWDIALRKGDTIVWGHQNSGSGQAGEVFSKSITIFTTLQNIRSRGRERMAKREGVGNQRLWEDSRASRS